MFTNSGTQYPKMVSIYRKSRLENAPYEHYSNGVTDCHLADLDNIITHVLGGRYTAAAFLLEFVSSDNCMDIDIAGETDLMSCNSGIPCM